uniref:Thiamine pyrophosphate-binding protein n=1 Tax=Micromonospora carbonacea TaxID=47853 RepID=A0A7D5Y7I7_9ACTN|nr:thiamine pyrophosphate-binding protein [Micromonospora carbonacea]
MESGTCGTLSKTVYPNSRAGRPRTRSRWSVVIELPARSDGKKSVSEYVGQWLSANDISQVFTLPGGMIAPILDAIHQRGDIDLVTMHHEQAVAFAADGVGRFAGTPGVAFATAGPGATNMLTAIASAYLDSVPAVFVTGQVQSYLLKGERPVRQYGFQECDVVAMAVPVTKAAWRARSGDEVPELLDRAMRLAVEGRPGPVLVELPSDVQTMSVPPEAAPRRAAATVPAAVDRDTITEVLDELASAARPLVLIGGGVQAARAADAARHLLRRLGAPVAASVTALDVLPAEDPLRLGMIGMYGNRWVNLAVSEADFVLTLGARLDFGTLGADVAAWGRGRRVVQVDCDPGEMRRVRGVRAIVADLRSFIDAGLAASDGRVFPEHEDWRTHIDRMRAEWPDTEELTGHAGINPNVLMRQLSAASLPAAAFVIDAGQHLWWACQSLRPAQGQRLLPALGLGPCGWAFPAAIGVACHARRPVVVVVGDGAFQFNIQELQTVARGRLPIKLVIVDNGAHGSVRQLQEEAFEGRYPTTVQGYDAPDFARVAQAYGIDSRSVSEPEEVADALSWLWRDETAPALLHVRIPTELNVYPNVPFGASLTVMRSQPGRQAAS